MREPRFLNWPGGEHPFILRIGGLLALEQSCATGVGAIFQRLSSGLQSGWHVLDVTETLRLGLIGGGMEREEAKRLVASVTDRVGLLELVPVALSVLFVSLASPSDDDSDEDEPDDPEKKKET